MFHLRRRFWFDLLAFYLFLYSAGCLFTSGPLRRTFAKEPSPFFCIISELKEKGIPLVKQSDQLYTFVFQDVPFSLQVYSGSGAVGLFSSTPDYYIDLDSQELNNDLPRAEIQRRTAAVESVASMVESTCPAVHWFDPAKT